MVWNSLLPFSPEVSTEIGSAGGVGDSLGSQVVSSSQLLSWGVVWGHSTIGVGNQGGSWDWEADSWNSKAVAQPWLSLSFTLLLAGAWDGNVESVHAWGGLETPAPSSKTVAQPWLGLSFALLLAGARDGSAIAVNARGSQSVSAPSPPGLGRGGGRSSQGSDDSGLKCTTWSGT